MECHTGFMKMLGNSEITKGTRQYSIIEIGDKVIKEPKISTALDNYLERALQNGGETRLWCDRHGFILCIEFEGKSYVSSICQSKPRSAFAFWALMITQPFAIPIYISEQKDREDYQAMLAKISNPIFI